MFHTQEKWAVRLNEPKPTTNKHSWLGDGWYFWYYEGDAVWWGRTAKTNTGYYEVYKADINCDNILDTVFNEGHYNFWIAQVDEVIRKFLKNNRNGLSLKYINDRFKEKGLFDEVDGVMFQDITDNREYWIIDKFQYKKRIQLAVYNLQIVSNFAFGFEAECA